MGINAQTWIKMCRQLSLSRAELEVVRRFEEDPSGRQFLPLSEVLRNHKLNDESLELLTQGVQDHATFAVARVVLIRELYQRGQILDAWSILERAPAPLLDNVLAQKLKYKMAILLGDETSAGVAFQNLKIQQGIDPEIRKLSENLEQDGIKLTRSRFIADLQAKGVQLLLPIEAKESGVEAAAQLKEISDKHAAIGRNKRFILEYELDEATRKQVDQFHVVPLSEVFVSDSDGNGGSKLNTKNHVELDSTTLAEIYSKQGLYSKALAIYRRLLRMAPHNDLLRLKVAEMARLDKDQKDDDLEQDPVVFDRMEVVEIIDRQIKFVGNLLDKIDKL